MNSQITFTFDGESLAGEYGQTVAAVLIDSGRREFRKTRFASDPRSIFCGIGICFDCVVTIDGISNQRACLIEIREGMKVESTP